MTLVDADIEGLPKPIPLGADEPARVLTRNIDTLYLTLNVAWQDDTFLTRLSDLRALGESQECAQQSEIELPDGSDIWRFDVLHYGMRGYAFILESHEMIWRLTSSLVGNTRPNVYVELRSEVLWRLTPKACIHRVLSLLHAAWGYVIGIKPSRVDLCVDVLLREEQFTLDLMPLIVTRAADIQPQYSRRKFSGFTIGKGNIKARLYDKPKEIICKNGQKAWMYVVWNMRAVPESHRIVRIEFEIRREILKQLGIEEIEDLHEKMPNLWAYCTQKWLIIKDEPEKQSHCREILPWWNCVQAGFEHAITANPLIRVVAVKQDKKQAFQQLFGQLSRLFAIDVDREKLEKDIGVDFTLYFPLLIEAAKELGLDPIEFGNRVRKKKAKFERASEMYEVVMRMRQEQENNSVKSEAEVKKND